jgi:hypothetical protein
MERKRDRTTLKRVRVRNEEVGKPSNYVDSTVFNCYPPIHADWDKGVISEGLTRVYEITHLVRLAACVFIVKSHSPVHSTR